VRPKIIRPNPIAKVASGKAHQRISQSMNKRVAKSLTPTPLGEGFRPPTSRHEPKAKPKPMKRGDTKPGSKPAIKHDAQLHSVQMQVQKDETELKALRQQVQHLLSKRSAPKSNTNWWTTKQHDATQHTATQHNTAPSNPPLSNPPQTQS
jgi:hypothetical protein